MKSIYILIIGTLICTCNLFGQTAGDLTIHDTRNINDVPSFNAHKIRADFKDRNIIGVPGSGPYSANLTISPWRDITGGLNHQISFNDGGIFYRTGSFSATSWNVWQKVLVENENGNVGIGTIKPSEKLDVRGKIRANEIIVNTVGADFVFADDYRLRPLQEVEQFITENKHLPDIASADSMVENGVGVSELQTKLLQKIEELTLYVIELEKQVKELQHNK